MWRQSGWASIDALTSQLCCCVEMKIWENPWSMNDCRFMNRDGELGSNCSMQCWDADGILVEDFWCESRGPSTNHVTYAYVIRTISCLALCAITSFVGSYIALQLMQHIAWYYAQYRFIYCICKIETNPSNLTGSYLNTPIVNLKIVHLCSPIHSTNITIGLYREVSEILDIFSEIYIYVATENT